MLKPEMYSLLTTKSEIKCEAEGVDERDEFQILEGVVDRFRKFKRRDEFVDPDFDHPEISGILAEGKLMVQLWRHKAGDFEAADSNLHRHLMAVADIRTGELVAGELYNVEESGYKDYSRLRGTVEVGGREFILDATSESVSMFVQVFEDEPKEINRDYIWRNRKIYRQEHVDDAMSLEYAVLEESRRRKIDLQTAV